MEADRYHEEAVTKLGKSFREQMNIWAMAYAVHDFTVWRVLRRELGRKKGRAVFIKIWAEVARMSADSAVKTLGITKVDIPALGAVAKHGYSVIACPYTVVKDTADEHVGQVRECPFHRYNSEIFGDHAKSDEMRDYWEDTADCTANYFKTMAEHLGRGKEVEGTSDKFICTGDDVCTVIFRRKKKT